MRSARSICVLNLAMLASLAGGCEDHKDSSPDARSPDRGLLDARKGELGAGDRSQGKDTGPAGPGRNITFKNMCPFEVWVGYTGSSASQIGCSTNDQCKSGVCNSKFVCECSSDAHCPTPQRCDTVNKRCQCTSKSECAAHQKCDLGNASWKQCFWIVDAPTGAGDSTPSWRLPAYKSGASVPTKQTSLPIQGTARDTTQVWSGAFYPRAGCDGIGRNCTSGDCGKCNPWEGPKAQPHTRVEMTLQNDKDWYNLSLIHGFNVPIMVAAEETSDAKFDPVPSASPNQKSFWCGNPGGTTYSSAAVTGATGWEGVSCKYDFDHTPAAAQPAGWATGYRVVDVGGTACSADGECTGTDKCGLTFDHVQDKSGALTCGSPIGWWSARPSRASSRRRSIARPV